VRGRREEKRDVMYGVGIRREEERWKRKKRFVNERLRKTGARPS